MKKKQSYIFTLVSMILVVTLITVSLITFIKTVNRYGEESNNKRMSEVAKKNNETLNSVFQGAYATLDVVRVILEDNENAISIEDLNILDKVSKDGYFDHLVLESASKKYYGGNELDSCNSYFDIVKNMKGDMYISDFILTNRDKQYHVDIAIPLRDNNGNTRGVLQGTLNIEKVLNKVIKNKFDEEGYYHLIDSNGRYISFPEEAKSFELNKNYFETMKKLDYTSGYSAQKIQTEISNNKSGHTKYSYKGDERYAYYEPVGINKWFMSTVIPSNIVNNESKKITYLGSELIIMLIVIVTIIYAVAIQLISKSTSIAQKQKEKLRLIEIEHERTLREISYSLFDNVLEADMTSNTLLGLNCEDLTRILGIKLNSTYDECVEVIVEKLVQKDFRDEYRSKMKRDNIIETFNSGKQVFTFECVQCLDGINYKWIMLTVRIYQCHNTNSIRIISYFKNIENEKRKEQDLLNKAERDSFTNLYNKITTEKKINKIIEEKKQNNHAFVIIDIDNFKLVNDTLGHAFGDEILLECANSIKELFHSGDVLGRIGGDEFIIFIPNYDSILEIRTKLEMLRLRLCKEYNQEHNKISISISTGVSLYPEHGKSFEELYNKSDDALYGSKKKGRNIVSFYDNGEDIIVVE